MPTPPPTPAPATTDAAATASRPRPPAHPPLIRVCRHVDLKPWNTFGVAATARVVYTLDALEQVDELLEALHRDEEAASDAWASPGRPAKASPDAAGVAAPMPVGEAPAQTATTGPAEAPAPARRPLILSGGSNLLLTRDLIEPVLLVRHRGRQILDRDGERVWLEVAAGEIWHETVRWSLDQGAFGLENLALIPGRVGAAPWQNIGAYGAEVGEFIESVQAVHLRTGERRHFAAADCGFGYRQSVFKTEAGRDWLIVSVRLCLSTRFEPRLGYAELATALGVRPNAATDRSSTEPGMGSAQNAAHADPGSGSGSGSGSAGRLTAALVADTVEAIRRRKLPDPAVLGNAGSFFHNPVVPAEVAEQLRRLHPGMPTHPSTEGALGSGPSAFKLSAGWLIDQCGWKGFRDGDAGVSPHHALVLVNHGHATGGQILDLAERIRHSVHERFGLWLQPEPVILR